MYFLLILDLVLNIPLLNGNFPPKDIFSYLSPPLHLEHKCFSCNHNKSISVGVTTIGVVYLYHYNNICILKFFMFVIFLQKPQMHAQENKLGSRFLHLFKCRQKCISSSFSGGSYNYRVTSKSQHRKNWKN